MNLDDKHNERAQLTNADHDAANDVELAAALSHFRQSVHAWSDSELRHPRQVVAPARRGSWRLAVGWALGCVLVAGAGSEAMYERRHQAELVRISAVQEAAHQRELAEQRAKEDEELLAKVDTYVSKEVPSAMEPLAQLMAEDESR